MRKMRQDFSVRSYLFGNEGEDIRTYGLAFATSGIEGSGIYAKALVCVAVLRDGTG